MTTLRTHRLVLGPHCMDDLEALHRWKNDAEILDMSADRDSASTREETQHTLARWMEPHDDIVHFAIRLACDGRPIGFLHIAMIDREHQRCRIGIVIGEKELWDQGYGTEAVHAALGHCFDTLGMNRVGAEAYSNNPGSIAMLEHAGFRREGVLRESLRRGGRFVDEHVFGVLRRDWLAGTKS